MGKKHKSKAPNRVLQTPMGEINLANEKDRRRLQRMVIDIQRSYEALTRKDIADWRNAWQWALNPENPTRRFLYDIYRDVAVDLHLSGCVEQRRGFVMAKSFKLVTENGDEDESLSDIIWKAIELSITYFFGPALIVCMTIFYIIWFIDAVFNDSKITGTSRRFL